MRSPRSGRAGKGRDSRLFAPRIMLYSHNTRGFGHAARSINLAWGVYRCLPEASILYCTGGAHPVYTLLPPNADVVKLPTLEASSDSSGADVTTRPARLLLRLSRVRAIRAAILTGVAESFRPHVLIADHFPLGKRNELEPALRSVRACSKHLIALGLRDVLNDPVRTQAYLAEQVYPVVRELVDQVFIYGDAAVYDPVRAYDMPDDIAQRCMMVGYVTPSHRPGGDPVHVRARLGCALQEPLILVNFGGGRDTGAQVQTVLDAWSLIAADEPVHLVIVGGPYAALDESVYTQANQLPRVQVIDVVPWLVDLIHVADLFIGTSSYNLAAELLAAGTPAILLPRAQVDSLEQTIRAEALARRSQFTWLADPDPAALAQAIRDMRARPETAPGDPPIDITGADTVARYVQQWLTGPT